MRRIEGNAEERPLNVTQLLKARGETAQEIAPSPFFVAFMLVRFYLCFTFKPPHYEKSSIIYLLTFCRAIVQRGKPCLAEIRKKPESTT